jgi:hypothetical protein
MVLVISILEFAVVNADIDGLESVSFWVDMLMDSVSLTFPFIRLDLYTGGLPFQTFALPAGVIATLDPEHEKCQSYHQMTERKETLVYHNGSEDS